MSYTIFYREAVSEGSGASLSTERNFCSCKVMSQYVRRHKIKDYSVYQDGRLCVLIGNKYIRVDRLMAVCSEAVTLDAYNTR